MSGDYAGAIAIYDKIIADDRFLAISKVEAYAARGIANSELGTIKNGNLMKIGTGSGFLVQPDNDTNFP